MENFLHITDQIKSSDDLKDFLLNQDFSRISYLGSNNFIFVSEESPSNALKNLCDKFDIKGLKCEYLSNESSGIIDITDGTLNEFRSEQGEGNKIVINSKGNWAHKGNALLNLEDFIDKAKDLGLKKNDKGISH